MYNIFICIYIYAYKYVYVYVYTYIYIYTYRFAQETFLAPTAYKKTRNYDTECS